jgi:hypothetical protein
VTRSSGAGGAIRRTPSTVEQTTEHQRAQAVAAGFTIDAAVADNSVSGVQTRLAERPDRRRLYDKLRRGDLLAPDPRAPGCQTVKDRANARAAEFAPLVRDARRHG